MELILFFFIFLFGLVIGSFLNVVIFRLETEESIAVSRSHCMDCKHNLSWYDLIPVLSFLGLWGKCRYCKKPISRQYPLVEMATALLFLLTFSVFGETAIDGQFSSLDSYFLFSVFYFLIVICSLIVIFVYDFKHYLIPDKIVFLLVILSLGYRLIESRYLGVPTLQHTVPFLLASLAASGFFLLLVVLSKGKGMGMGDVKFAFALGLILGWPIVAFSLFVSFILGSLIGMLLVVFKKKNFKSEIPFGPFLVFGALVGMLWGTEVIKWYLNYLV